MVQGLKPFVISKVRKGSLLWYVFAFPKRLRDRRVKFLRSCFDYYLIKKSNERRLKGKKLKKGCITTIITSAGRREYLEPTIESLRKNFIYDRDKVLWYIIDDYPDSTGTRQYIGGLAGFDLKILNARNKGLGYCLNQIYAEVNTEFVFHCEDDWLFLRPIPVEHMMRVLQENPHLRQLLLFRVPIGRDYRGEVKITSKGYAEYYHRFSFNPHLAKTELFIEHQPFPLYYTELEYTIKLERSGQTVSGILGYGEEPYVKHLGVNRKTKLV